MFYGLLASWLKTLPEGGTLYLAVGAGQTAWDTQAPEPSRATARLENELFRKRIDPRDVVYLDADQKESAAPTARLLFRVSLGPSEAVGVLRESGLFAGAAGPEGNSGTLISYATYAPLTKTADLALERFVRLDLMPRTVTVTPPPPSSLPPPPPPPPSPPSPPPTPITESRYLGNSNSSEFHDLANAKPRCGISRIRADRRRPFATVDAALAAGYDYCSYCFSTGLSKR